MGRRLALGGLAAFALAGITAAACDEGESAGPIQACGSCCVSPVTGTDAGYVPARPTGTPAVGTGRVVLAISRLHFSEADGNYTTTTGAWTRYGLNIDGKVTGTCSKDTCTLVPGSSREVQLDGQNGIDNSFGWQLEPVLDTIDQFESDTNTAIQQGGATMLIELEGMGGGPSYGLLEGALFRAVPTMKPKWDGTDIRDVDDMSLLDGSTAQPASVFRGGYMNERVWVGTSPTGTAFLDLHLVDGSRLPPIPIHHAQLVMQVAADGGSATSGTLAGVIRTSELMAWFQLWAGGISKSLCGGSAFESIALQIEQMSDIMADGTNEPGQTCDGISIGLGFDAVAVQLGQAVSTPPLVDPCSDAGVAGTD